MKKALSILMSMLLLAGTMMVLPAKKVRAEGTEYYVDSVNGSDSNGGTSQNAPWKTLEKVSGTTFQPGDKILFKSGCMFTGVLYPKGSGSGENPIIIDKYGTGSNPMIQGNTDTSGDSAAVLLKNQEYWEIHNLNITNAGGIYGVRIMKDTAGTSNYYRLTNLKVHNVHGELASDRGTAVFFDNNATAPGKFNDILVEGCEIYDVRYVGIAHDQTQNPETSDYRATNFIIRNTIVHDSGHDGLILRCADNSLVENCTFYRTGLSQARHMAGAWLKYCNNSIIQQCEAYGNMDGPAYTDGQGFDLDVDVDNSILQYCYSHDNEGGFVLISGTEGPINDANIVRYNISENDGEKTFTFSNKYRNSKIYNNTIYVSGSVPLKKVVNLLASDAGNIDNLFNNNIISVHAPDFGYNSHSSVSYDYNLFYGTHPASEPADSHKLTSDPLFVSPNSGGTGLNSVDGYKLQTGSPALNAGTVVGSNGGRDYWNNAVPETSNPNIGAYNGSGVTVSEVFYEAENLPEWDNAYSEIKDAQGMSNAKYHFLYNCVVGDLVEYTVSVPSNGIYTIKAGVSEGPARGMWQMKIDGENQGSGFDAYDASWKVTEADMGSKYLVSGEHKIRFIVTGKNAGATSYNIGFDYITLAK